MVATGNEVIWIPGVASWREGCGAVSKLLVMRCSACLMMRGVSVSSWMVRSSCLM